jgi:hypothetical protein
MTKQMGVMDILSDPTFSLNIHTLKEKKIKNKK